ncbi:MAG: hypothetical protein ACRDXD_03975 [Acidimicrobiia bacterium]
MRRSSALLWAVLAACGGEPQAASPPLEAIAEACTAEFCVRYPAGWEVEEQDESLTFQHSEQPQAIASVSLINMQFLVEANQGTWPSPVESVERDFWELQEEGTPDTRLEELVPEPDGSVRSRGRVEGLVQWHRLVPIGAGPGAVGVTVRAPDIGWEPHARVFLEGVSLEET